MDGCKKIIQMIVGGMTQYLTQVQGMPKDIEKKLKKRIRQFLWAEKKLSPINFETLLASKNEGGQEALDIEARNLAIEVMWLKLYFGLADDKPIWSKVADAMMAGPKATPGNEKNIDPEIKRNYFAQLWKTKISVLPEHLRKLVKTARTIGL